MSTPWLKPPTETTELMLADLLNADEHPALPSGPDFNDEPAEEDDVDWTWPMSADLGGS